MFTVTEAGMAIMEPFIWLTAITAPILLAVIIANKVGEYGQRRYDEGYMAGEYAMLMQPVVIESDP